MSVELVKVRDSPAVDLVAEANHGIANHMAMIAGLLRLQGAEIVQRRQELTRHEVRFVLEEFAGRLETVAKVHRLLSHGEDGGPIKLDPYLRDVAERMVSSLSGAGKQTLHCEFSTGCVLSSEKAVTLGLLVGELVTNAVKYAHPAGVDGKISVAAATTRDGSVAVVVSDDGVGQPEDLDPLQGGGTGFRIIQALAAKLDGAFV